jgi:hypothetical protein
MDEYNQLLSFYCGSIVWQSFEAIASGDFILPASRGRKKIYSSVLSVPLW